MVRLPLLKYSAALLFALAALAIQLSLDPILGKGTPFLFFFGAAMLSAWYGGLGPGLLATALGALLANLFFLPPDRSFRFLFTTEGFVRTSIFFLEGFLMSYLFHALRLNRERIQRLNMELEQKVIDRTAALEAANKELEAFSYSVSHDLRAPLRSVNGFSQVLLEDYADRLDEGGKETIERIRAATRRMGQLIDDLLKLSRVTRGEIHREEVDLSRMAKEMAEELRGGEPERSVAFDIQEGVRANADPQLLRTIMVNLIENAWKFTRKKSDVRIAFGLMKEGGRKVYYIKDNGAGFDMTYANKLFTPFQRLHTPKEFEGTGIGLATVQRIIRRHGGEIWAEGKVDEGATFYFTLQSKEGG